MTDTAFTPVALGRSVTLDNLRTMYEPLSITIFQGIENKAWFPRWDLDVSLPIGITHTADPIDIGVAVEELLHYIFLKLQIYPDWLDRLARKTVSCRYINEFKHAVLFLVAKDTISYSFGTAFEFTVDRIYGHHPGLRKHELDNCIRIAADRAMRIMSRHSEISQVIKSIQSTLNK